MPFPFTKDDLNARAGSTVFSRGLNYLQSDAVSDIKAVADKYTAKVYGRSVYSVDYSPDENDFSCNCPYGGFCKHSVAFGLKLLDEQEHLPVTKSFEKWFNSFDDKLKLSFLERLVQNDITLKEKLDKMNKQANNNEPVGINDVAEVVFIAINALSYDDVLNNQSGYDYYIEEYEIIDDLVRDALDNYLEEVEGLLRNNKPQQAFNYILGIYLGFQKSYETEISDYIDGFENFLDEHLSKFTESIKEQSDELKLKILNTFIEFYKSSPVNSFYFFENLLSLYVTGNHSNKLKQFLIDYLDDYTAKQLLMQIAELNQDIMLMENLLKGASSVSLFVPYLNLLKKNGDFKKIKQVLLKFSGSYDICTLEKFVQPELGITTYKQLLLRLIKECFQLKHYKKFKSLLTADEQQRFLSDIQKDISYSNEKYVLPVLFFEKIYDPVVKIIEDKTRSEWGFDSYIQYLSEIAKTLPDKVWAIYLKHVDFLFADRKRSAYAAMTQYLQMMQGINREKTEQLIESYYNHKPVLRALRDEFKKAGIV